MNKQTSDTPEVYSEKMAQHDLFSEESYLIQDDFEPGDSTFEAKVHKIGAFPNLVRQMVRQNYQLKKRMEELEQKMEELEQAIVEANETIDDLDIELTNLIAGEDI